MIHKYSESRQVDWIPQTVQLITMSFVKCSLVQTVDIFTILNNQTI